MAGVNKVILVGRLGKDPELKYTQSGVAVCNFSMATSREWKDKNTGEKQEETEWHRIVAWRRIGEVCGEYLHKGSQVYIEGRLQTRSWEDQTGNKRWTTEVVVDNMQMLDSQGGNGGNQDSRTQEWTPPDKPQDAPQQGTFLPPEDDIPF